MPYKIVQRTGKRRWKIVETKHGYTKTVGSSTTKKNAEASIRARYRGENMSKPKVKRNSILGIVSRKPKVKRNSSLGIVGRAK
jgi:hypothetical protein